MSSLPQQPSESTRKLNPHLWPDHQITTGGLVKPTPPLRQSSKPKCNKVEAAFSAWIKSVQPDSFVLDQAIKFRLCNGSWFTPDCVLFNALTGTICAYEVKGKRRADSAWFREDSKLKVKFAAKEYPFFVWYVVWKQDEQWQLQQVREL